MPKVGQEEHEILWPVDLNSVFEVTQRSVAWSHVTLGLEQLVQGGLAAGAIKVDVATGVSGFLRPGDRVDVYWSGNARGENVTRLIQASLQIIAIDQTDDEDRNNPTIARTITVEAPPDQIAALAQAQATGNLTLALVGVRDDTESETIEVTNRILRSTERELQARGYPTLRHAQSYMMPTVQTIRLNNGILDGGADPSGDGMALGV